MNKTPTLPVEVHCHGFGEVDFSEFSKLDLALLNQRAAEEGVVCLPTLYLRRSSLAEFEWFMRRFAGLRRAGQLPHIPGIALEGPLLASHGGTPAATVWAPTRHEWERLARLGDLGLVYTVLSPDAFTTASGLRDNLDDRHPPLRWIVPLLLAHGVRPALGHFTRADPTAGAELVRDIVDIAWDSEWHGEGARVITDHLFNDMPLNIRHAFRTRAARAKRAATLAAYDLPNWALADMDQIAGPVPAAIMNEAARGRIAACINFDGEHVDLAIASRAAELMGHGNTMLMTDRCDSARIGFQDLHQTGDNGLWYQGDGIVAAGSQPLARQTRNARDQGVADDPLWQLVGGTARRAFGFRGGDTGRPSGALSARA